jgi:beta-mannosidase
MEAWEAPLEVQAALAPVQEALRRPPPGAYRLVGEAWEGERLWFRHEVVLTYLPPLLPQGVAW